MSPSLLKEEKWEEMTKEIRKERAEAPEHGVSARERRGDVRTPRGLVHVSARGRWGNLKGRKALHLFTPWSAGQG